MKEGRKEGGREGGREGGGEGRKEGRKEGKRERERKEKQMVCPAKQTLAVLSAAAYSPARAWASARSYPKQ